jgi:hypothetical protein
VLDALGVEGRLERRIPVRVLVEHVDLHLNTALPLDADTS